MASIRRAGILSTGSASATNVNSTPTTIYTAPADCLRVELCIDTVPVASQLSYRWTVEHVTVAGVRRIVPMLTQPGYSPFQSASLINQMGTNEIFLMSSMGTTTVRIVLNKGESIAIKTAQVSNNAPQTSQFNVIGVEYDRTGAEDDNSVPFWVYMPSTINTLTYFNWMAELGTDFNNMELSLLNSANMHQVYYYAKDSTGVSLSESRHGLNSGATYPRSSNLFLLSRNSPNDQIGFAPPDSQANVYGTFLTGVKYK